MIRYKCPKCGVEMESPGSRIGGTEVCPNCKASVRVPRSPIIDDQGRLKKVRPRAAIRRALDLIPAHLRRRWWAYAILVAAVLFGVFVWPTLYMYRTHKTRWGDLARINRVTQSVSVLHEGEWVSLRELERRQREAEERRIEAERRRKEQGERHCLVPSFELKKIKFEPTDFSWRSFVAYRLYNGTDRPLASFAVDFHADGKRYDQVGFTECRPPVQPGSWFDGTYRLSSYPQTGKIKDWHAELRAAKWVAERPDDEGRVP